MTATRAGRSGAALIVWQLSNDASQRNTLQIRSRRRTLCAMALGRERGLGSTAAEDEPSLGVGPARQAPARAADVVIEVAGLRMSYDGLEAVRGDFT